MLANLRVIARSCSLLLVLSAVVPAADPSLSPPNGVLVLRNGRALKGEVLRDGQAYIVRLDRRSELRVPASQVEFACRDMEAAYQRKASRIGGRNAAENLDLAEWCLEQRMLAHAAKHVIVAMKIDPYNPRIESLERRLNVAANPPRKLASSPSRTNGRLSPDQVDRMLSELPAGSIEGFTTTIQPLLLNRCSAATCHGPKSSSDFRLMPSPWGGTMTRRLTQRNLIATLARIDRQQPEKSPLVTVPLRPHGTAQAAVFDERQMRQHRQIALWVERVTRSDQTSPPARDRQSDAELLQTAGQQLSAWP